MAQKSDPILDFFNLSKEFKKVTIQGSQTGGRVKRTEMDQPPPETNDAHVNNEPLDYYKQYRDAEEQRMIQSATAWHGSSRSTNASVLGGARSVNAMSGIESDTIAETLTIPANDMQDDHIDLTKQFNFKKMSRESHQLPICSYKEKIIDYVHSYPVVVVSGFTGCGKTTQVPQYILDKHAADRKRVNIIVTQPRRLAARSVAERVCQERGWELGKLVGYQVGLDKANKTPDTRLLYVTTGVLKRMLINKKSMNDWTHIILDEVHERDQDMDFVMLLCKKLLHSNSRGVKIILMSATMNEHKFSEYFSYVFPGINKPEPAPSIILPTKKKINKVQEYALESFRSFFPPGQDMPSFQMGDAKLEDFCIDVCRTLIMKLDSLETTNRESALKEGRASPEAGAILVFLPGLAEIQTVQEWLKEKNGNRKGTEREPKWWILPLHSSIPVEEHRLIFKKAEVGQRKIILSTNIAESSITIPDIVYVIDFCLTKNIQADQDTNYPQLVMEWASKQQCVQRMGRAGRVQEGRVYHLVNSSFYRQLKEEHEAQLRRAPLSKVVLDTKLLDFGNPKELLSLAMDPPDLLKLQKTIVGLKEMGALLTTVNNELSYDDGDLTVLGEIIANLPVDVRLGKLIVYGHIFNVLEDAIIIAAGLNGKSMFTAPFEKRIQAYKNKLWWADRTFSDCFAIMLAYKTWDQKHRRGEFQMGNRDEGRRREQSFCNSSFLQMKVLHEMKLQVEEIEKNLAHMDIKSLHLQGGGQRLGESQEDRALILRLIMFGAFYPNYFQRQNNSELETQAIRKLMCKDKTHDHNPKACVYLTGFPTDQVPFGVLYENQFKNIFAAAAYQNETENAFIEVVGQNVIVEFKRPVNEGSMTYSNKGPAGDHGIMPQVYVATKMRSAGPRNKTIVNLYTEEEGQRRFNEWKRAVKESGDTGLGADHVDQVQPPNMNVTSLEFSIQHINDPNNFWIHIMEDNIQEQEEMLQIIIGRRISQLCPPEPGMCGEFIRSGAIVLAPYEELYYRGKVKAVDANFATIFFIDYGNMERVDVSRLRVIDKSFIMQDPDIVRIPGLALECALAHIQPNKLTNGQGLWSDRALAEFNRYLLDSSSKKYGEIFSVTKASSGHNNFLVSLKSMEVIYNGKKTEMRNYLLKEKFAEKATESYKSEEDAKERAKFSDYGAAMQEHLDDFQGKYKIDRPRMKAVEDKKSQTVKCELRGPFSPLEYKVSCAYRQGSTKLVNTDRDSVNSVLLDQTPSNRHELWMVAAHVGVSPNGENLLARNTTWLPARPGMGALATIIFAPQVELRTNYPNRTKLTGFVAGLGSKSSPHHNGPQSRPSSGIEDTYSYFPEHDMEVKFDVEVVNDDINTINKIRYWINQVLSKSEDGMYGLIKPQTLHKAQSGIKQHLDTLLGKERQFEEKQHLPSGQEYRWNLLKKKHRRPSQLAQQDKYFLKMIDGVDLNLSRDEEMSITEIYNMLVSQYNLEGSSMERFPEPLECPCCPRGEDGNRVRMCSPREIYVHNQSQIHQNAEAPYLPA